MKELRKKRGLEGVLVVNKPEGIPSYDVIRRLKPHLKGVKVGYIGILDPLARGVLPLLFGEATKLAPFLEEGRKVYDATIRLGITTNTQDRDGEPLRVVEDLAGFDLSPQRIEEVLREFEGRIKQIPPMFSAKKYKGRPLYKYARRGEEVYREPKEVEIYKLELKGVELPFVHILLECSKGTYVRTLAHDIGERLGCGGHLYALTRLRNGPFGIEEARELDEVEELARQGRLPEVVKGMAEALSFLPAVVLRGRDLYTILHGGSVAVRDGAEGQVRLLDEEGGLVAVGTIERLGGELRVRPLRVFPRGYN